MLSTAKNQKIGLFFSDTKQYPSPTTGLREQVVLE